MIKQLITVFTAIVTLSGCKTTPEVQPTPVCTDYTDTSIEAAIKAGFEPTDMQDIQPSGFVIRYGNPQTGQLYFQAYLPAAAKQPTNTRYTLAGKCEQGGVVINRYDLTTER